MANSAYYVFVIAHMYENTFLVLQKDVQLGGSLGKCVEVWGNVTK